MAKYEWTETFLSIEGEAKYTGHPTMYIRFSRCNFACPLFNNTPNNITPDGYAPLGFEPKDYKTLQDLPLITKGCDSQYAVHPNFAHMWHKGDENTLADEVMGLLPHNAWINPKTGHDIILSLTGGEPTLRAKTIPALLQTPQFADVKRVLIETNCSVTLPDMFIQALNDWTHGRSGGDRKIIWSNSPKLSSSGEPWKKAIRPEVAVSQRGVGISEQYFKFVCGPNEHDFNEVEKAMKEYYLARIPKSSEVYIMPVACTEEQQQEIASKVAHMCMERGYIYCHRVQNSVFGNGVGT